MRSSSREPHGRLGTIARLKVCYLLSGKRAWVRTWPHFSLIVDVGNWTHAGPSGLQEPVVQRLT